MGKSSGSVSIGSRSEISEFEESMCWSRIGVCKKRTFYRVPPTHPRTYNVGTVGGYIVTTG